MNNNEWIDIDVLEDYLDGKLDAKAMYQVERLSLEDPFVAEALAGLSQSPKRVESLSLLQKQLQERIAQKPVDKKRWQITSQRLSIAAAAAVLFVTVSLLFWMREKGNREQLAAQAPKSIEVAIPPVSTNEKSSAELDKVIAAAKANSYAGNVKKTVKKPLAPVAAPIVEQATVDAPALLTFRAAEEAKKSKVANSPMASLQGKVSGLKIGNDKNSVKGFVYGEDKLPIVGAAVTFKGTSIGAVTNEKGEFNLTLDSLVKNSKLNVAYLGFLSKEVNVKKGDNLGIELKADNSSLNEVVVVGKAPLKRKIASATSTVFVRPEPVGGWDKFQTYLIDNNKLLVDKKPIGKHITVSFDLESDGTPINISASPVLKSAQPLSEGELKEVSRLFKEGPKWVLPNNSASGSTTVNIVF
ncbi:carboxypeptidase-like regulatory domain-containing protein [Pedobacter insulae]|uniref:CarboxypepD_reg-like domain-containing protein n=1 Tax=Pedobacter insulae TaxID=414048 RepID=A0A1I2YUG2_9SPHI|nr:carboxypeptidase-like regulatory domain-containing protein [Pedobacter insulae]SFH29313.1 CarboxypepD_reg-like domain-containing protein [Pedobacter insulae]